MKNKERHFFQNYTNFFCGFIAGEVGGYSMNYNSNPQHLKPRSNVFKRVCVCERERENVCVCVCLTCTKLEEDVQETGWLGP